jgi:sialidase-1
MSLVVALTIAAAACSAAPAERWIHPLCETPGIQLPEVFDQQTMVRLGDGRLMTVQAGGNATLTSADDGRTWSEPRPIRSETVPVKPTRGPLIRTQSGTLILLFQDMAGQKERWDAKSRDWTSAFRSDLWVTRSRDEGQSWETPRMPFEGAYGTIVDAIQTRSGHVVVPVEVVLTRPGRWGIYVFVSPDEGATWTRSNLLDLGGNGHHDGAIEPTLVELQDGRLLMLIRTSLDRFWEAYSDDHGCHWCQWGPSRIDASTAPGCLRRLASGRLVLVWNRLAPEGAAEPPRIGPSDAYERAVSHNRTELSIAFSDDDAGTWSAATVIARQVKGSLGYPFVLEASPGKLWIWTRFGSRPPVCVGLREDDLTRLNDPRGKPAR